MTDLKITEATVQLVVNEQEPVFLQVLRGPIVVSGGGGVTVHNDLTGRSDPDAHPISSITGLSAALAAAGNVDSVNGQTGTVSLDLDDLTDVDTTTDPPDADDVLAWDGTLWTPAALTAADTGAIPASLIDAKGDVIVGTAADTAARLGVGSDGQVLTADSAQASGVKWAAASSPRRAGSYYLNGMAGGNFTPVLNQLYLTPLPFRGVTISAIAMQVVLSGGAGSVVRLGLYAWGDGEPSGSPIIDAGIVSATSWGVKEVAITPTNVTHACLAMVWQGGTPNAVSGLSTTGSQVGGMLIGTPTAVLGTGAFPATCWTVAGVTGALPSISSVGTIGDFAPRMLVKVV